MNENLNLVEILKDCPKGTKLYSTTLGEVEFDHIENFSTYRIIIRSKHYGTERLTANGKMYSHCGECILFPSKEQRDWSKFTAPWCNLEKQRDKDKLIQELGEYKVKYTQEVSEKCINSMSNKDDERLRKTAIAFLKDFAEQGYENAVECIDWLEKQCKKSSWKPSKEEMDVLYSLSYITNEYDEHKEDVITHLYQDLKREFFNDSSYENMFSLDNKEDDVRRRSTIQVLEYARSLDAYNQYGKADIDKNIAWLEKQGKQASSQTNERAWLYLVSDVLTWKDGIGQYLDDPRVQELAKRLCSEYAQKLYNPSILSNSSNTGKNKQKSSGEIEPKFQPGNWYRCTKNFVGKGVTFDRNTAYYCTQEGCLQDEYGCHIAIVKDLYDIFKLWTIQDAKDGDILAISWWEDKDLWEKIIIFKKYHSDGVKGLFSMPCVEGYGNTFKNGKLVFKEEVPYYSRTWTCKLHPATKEQRDTFVKAMNDAGYEWDTEKKELNKKGGFDPKTLKPFDNVLVRDYSYDVWNCSILSHAQQKGSYNYACINGANWKYCIPYNDDTKHLVGTTEEAPEYYRYWED